jgi:hypothetical protein
MLVPLIILGVYSICYLFLMVVYVARLARGLLKDTFQPYGALLTSCFGWLWLAMVLGVLSFEAEFTAWIVYAGICLLSAVWMAMFMWRLSSAYVLILSWFKLSRKTILWPWDTDDRISLELHVNSELVLCSTTAQYACYAITILCALLILVCGTVPLSIAQQLYTYTFADLVTVNDVWLYTLDGGIGLALLVCTIIAGWCLRHLQPKSQMFLELIVVLTTLWITFGLQIGLRQYMGVYYISWPALGLIAFQAISLGRSSRGTDTERSMLERVEANIDGWKATVTQAAQWRSFSRYARKRGYRLHVEFVELYHTLVSATLAQFEEDDRQRVFNASIQWGLLNELMPVPPISTYRLSRSPASYKSNRRKSNHISSITGRPSDASTNWLLHSRENSLSSTRHNGSMEQSLKELALETSSPPLATRPIPQKLVPAYMNFHRRFIDSETSRHLQLTQEAIDEVNRCISLKRMTIYLFQECYAQVEWQLYHRVFADGYARVTRAPDTLDTAFATAMAAAGRAPRTDTVVSLDWPSYIQRIASPVRFPGQPPIVDIMHAQIPPFPISPTVLSSSIA